MTRPAQPARRRSSRPAEGRFGAYSLVQLLESDGDERLFLARSERDQGMRLLRLLPARLSRNPHCARSFAAAMRSAQMLRHSNLAAVLEFGSAGGILYCAEEAVGGHSLARLVERARSMGVVVPRAAAVAIATQLLDGLEALRFGSDAAILSPHTEVCPGHVYVTHSGRVLLGKIGCTRWAVSADAVGDAPGCPGYAAPEVLEAPTQAGESADVFSVGVVLAELLVGRPLFERSTRLAAFSANHDADLRHLWERPDALSEDLLAVLTGALEREPRLRYATAADFRAALNDATQLLPSPNGESELLGWLAALRALPARSGEHVIGEGETRPTPLPPPSPASAADDGQLALCAERIATGRPMVDSNLSGRSRLGLRRLAASSLLRFGEDLRQRASWVRAFDRSRFPAMLFDLARSGASGTLVLRFGEMEKRVCYDGGVPRAFASTLPSDLFGRRFVDEGLMTATEVDACAARATRAGLRLGEQIVEEGHLPTSLVFNQLLRHCEDAFSRMGVWRSGTIAFVDEDCPSEKLPLSLRPHAAQIADLVRRHYTIEELAQILHHRRHVRPHLSESPPFSLEELELLPPERAGVHRAGLGGTFSQLVASMNEPGGPDLADTLRGLVIALSAGFIDAPAAALRLVT